MTLYLNNQTDLDAALQTLVVQDPRLAPVLARAGLPALRRRETGFAGLAAIICGQQLSVSAAAAIWGRLNTAFDPFHHDHISKARTDRLSRLGLSAAKIKSLKAIAKELRAARLDLDRLGEESADVAHAKLTALHGVGPWTADIYLLFCLGHSDAWPAGDLALQEAIRVGLNLKARPNAKQASEIAEAWRPLRGAAAHLWWAYYHVIKQREGAPVTQPAKPTDWKKTPSKAASAGAKLPSRKSAKRVPPRKRSPARRDRR